MRSLHFLEPGRTAWREVAEPRLEGPGEALVRPLAVARCDLDAAVLRGEAPFRGRLLHWCRNHLPEALGQRGLFRNAPFRGPFALGHECVGEVASVGPEVRSFAVGDRVAVSFQICCGRCARCSAGLTGSCTAVPPRSMYGFGDLGGHRWGGALSDLLRVPFAEAMLVRLPPDVDPAAYASASDNVADGWRTVGPQLQATPGAPVLVMGGAAASIGLYAAGLAVALGAGEVDYVDTDPLRLRLAEQLGAKALEQPARAPLRRRYPITVDACADPRGLQQALRATAPGGICTSVGIYYRNLEALPLLEMYGTGVTFATGRVQSRVALPTVLALIASRFPAQAVTTRTVPWDQAGEGLLDPGPKVVVVR